MLREQANLLWRSGKLGQIPSLDDSNGSTVFRSPVVVDRVPTAGTERVAAQETSGGKHKTAARTEIGNGLAGKFRTRGGEAAGRACPWRNYELIGSDTCDQKGSDHRQLSSIRTAANSSRTSL